MHHPVVVVGGHRDHRAGELWRGIRHHRPRRETEIRGSAQRESPTELGLPPKPGNGVGSVIDLVDERFEIPTGPERAPNALIDDDVAVRRV